MLILKLMFVSRANLSKGKCKYVFLFSLFLFAKISSAQELSIVMPSQTLLMEELILLMEEKYDLLFTYKQEDIRNLMVTPPRRSLKTSAFFSLLLKESDLQYEIINNKYVLLSKVSSNEISESEKDQVPQIQLCGTVKDKLTGEPLIAANVYLKKAKKGAITSADGSFQLQVPFITKSDSLIISYVGYQEQQLAVSKVTKKPCLSILLDYYQLNDDFVIVKEYLTDGILLGDHGAYIQLKANKMGALPGQVEPDVLNTIHFLPGVSSQDGTPSGICVQGGTPDQNLILWEGIPIYHTAHYFGMLSAFNPYIIDKVAVYTGGFGAEYGGRISSVIKLESETTDKEKSTIGAGTNLIYSFLDGQLITKNKDISAVFSVRRSMIELWRSPTFKNITKRVHQGVLVQNIDLNRLPPAIHINDDFLFFDTHLKFNYQLSEKDQIAITGFYARNDFEDFILDDIRKQAQADTFFSENSGLNISWERKWQPNFTTNLMALNTAYHYNYGYSLLSSGVEKPDKIGRKRNTIHEKQIHLLNQFKTPKSHILKLGYQLINYNVGFDIIRNGIQDGTGNKNANSNIHTLYTDFKTNSNKNFGVNIGLRLNHYEQINKQYVEPRLRIWHTVSDAMNVYVSAGKYYQYLSQLIQVEGDQASIKTPAWALAGSKEVPVLDANHLQTGMVFRKNTWLIDLQAYAKKVKGLTSLASGFDEGLSNTYHLGNAHIRGLDLLVKKRWNNYKSWLSYSLKKNEHHFSTFFDTDFAASIDQRHIFKWANIWTVGNVEYALGWSISSGRPFSPISDFRVKVTSLNNLGPREVVFPVTHNFNSRRLPAEHQLDASIRYHFKGKMKGMIGLSLYNIYHQKNILSRAIYIDNRPGMLPRLVYNDTVNMGFTPSFILRIEW